MSSFGGFGSPPAAFGLSSSTATATTTASGFSFGSLSPAALAPRTTAAVTSGGTSSFGGTPNNQVSVNPIPHTAQSLASFSAATQSATFNTPQSVITFSVLFRTSTTKADSLDALIVIHDALAKPLMARFALTLGVERTMASVSGRPGTPSSLTVGPSNYSSPSMARISAPCVVQVVCDCSSMVPIIRTDPLPVFKINAITVTVQQSEVADVSWPFKLSTHQLALLSTLDDPNLSDCALLPNDSPIAIRVSRAILAQSSSFFKSMFQGPWMESSQSDDNVIPIGWSVTALMVCLIHVYSAGTWLPHHQVPKVKALKAVLAKMQVSLPLLESMTRHQWNELIDLAVMLELFGLAKVANRQLSKLLDVEQGKLDEDAKSLEQKMRAALLEE